MRVTMIAYLLALLSFALKNNELTKTLEGTCHTIHTKNTTQIIVV